MDQTRTVLGVYSGRAFINPLPTSLLKKQKSLYKTPSNYFRLMGAHDAYMCIWLKGYEHLPTLCFYLCRHAWGAPISVW